MSTEVLYSTGRQTEKGRAVMDRKGDVRCASSEGDKYVRSAAKKLEHLI
jgi:hypothetical protein